jgi:hypothetical protein
LCVSILAQRRISGGSETVAILAISSLCALENPYTKGHDFDTRGRSFTVLDEFGEQNDRLASILKHTETNFQVSTGARGLEASEGR